MSEEPNNQIESQIVSENEQYNDSLHKSNVHSTISHFESPEKLLKHFENYVPVNTMVSMEKLHSSSILKLKKYKESIYYGEFINGKRHGLGIMMYDNQRLYEGEWKCDYKHGQGYEKFPTLCIYQGDYVNGKPEGVGRYSWPNGEFYEGEWINGMKEGSGMWRGAKGDSYIGEWRFGKADGYGVHTWVNGDRYEGEFKDSLKHGEGIEKFANGDIYKGLYVNGKPNGYGEYYWSNGSYFKGEFKNGLRDGHGTWKRGPGNSDMYEGDYENDKKSGFGIFTWATGNIYKGNYLGDGRNGYGEMYWNDGSYYKGQWRNGVQNGEGLMSVIGEGIKKGIFEDNVLMILEEESCELPEKNNYFSHYKYDDGIQDPEKIMTRSKARPNHDLESHYHPKNSFRSRGYSSKRGRIVSEKQKTIDHSNLQEIRIKLNENKSKNFDRTIQHKFLPKNLNSFKSKLITLEKSFTKPKTENKERVLHSSFYMHKIHKATNFTMSRADASSGLTSEDMNIGRENFDDGRSFNKSRVSTNTRVPFV